MLSLDAGFHPDMTGRQNTAINATPLGMAFYFLLSKIANVKIPADAGDFPFGVSAFVVARKA